MDMIEDKAKPTLEALTEHQLATRDSYHFLGALRQNTFKNSEINRRSSLISSQAQQKQLSLPHAHTMRPGPANRLLHNQEQGANASFASGGDKDYRLEHNIDDVLSQSNGRYQGR